MTAPTTAYSLLDLSPIPEGSDAARSMRNSLDLAQHAERWGYRRFWLAEHHNMPGIASAATAVLIGYVANGTSTIRVGSGGIMLPNHSPLVVAEQFGTLASLFPGRIDLGLGRAPGTDQLTARALRRSATHDTADTFPQDVEELQAYFDEPRPGQRLRAVPGAGLKVPLWLLGSSLFSAQLAASMGLPFAFASHFAPGFMRQAVDLYRQTFRPSEALSRPYVMLGLNVFAADTDAEATRLFSSLQQQFLALVRGTPGRIRPPVDDIESMWNETEAAHIRRSLSCSVVGSLDTVCEGMQRFVDDLRPDELMLTAQIYDHQARLRSFELAAQAAQQLRPVSGAQTL